MPLAPIQPLSVLQRRKRLLSDSAMGSELIFQGVSPAQTIYANTVRPDLVSAIHEANLGAGADILTTNTFGLPNESDTMDDWLTQVAAGQRLALEAAERCSREVCVWTTLAPAMMEMAHKAKERFWEAFRSDGTLSGGLLIETCVSLREAREAAQIGAAMQPALLAVTCHFNKQGLLPDGSTPEAVVTTLIEAGADIVGGNCGVVPEAFISVAHRMRQTTDNPLLFQPNAGLPLHNEDGKLVYPMGPEVFARIAETLWKIGVNIVGGCCGTTPAHLAACQLRWGNDQNM